MTDEHLENFRNVPENRVPFFSQRPNFAETERGEERDTPFITAGPRSVVIHDAHRMEITGFHMTQSKKDRSDMYLFEYAVTYTPRNDAGEFVTEDARILIPPTSMLARSKQTVERTATRAVVDVDLNWDDVNVLVRPFD